MKFLRYPGGKSKLLYFLTDFLPKPGEIGGTYIEPFVGGGSVFLFMNPSKAIISDLNKDLIDLYKGIKLYPHKVWEIFCQFPEGKEAYYQIRGAEYKTKPLYFRAARTLYLNRTCFKGMWRNSPNGDFNVGYGGESRRWVVTQKNILELSKAFKQAEIVNCDFDKTLGRVSNGDFVFLDPPYKPGEKEMKDKHYANGRFSFQEQIRLAHKLKSLEKIDFKWMMTNSDHPDILDLYNGYCIRKVPFGTSSNVGIFTENSKEVLISNF